MSVRIIAAFALAGLLLLPSTGALAAGAGAVSTTEITKNGTQSFPSPNPCTGVPGTVTITFNGVFHITTLPGGELWLTFTQTGTVTAVPLDPTQPTLTGRFTVWGNQNVNEQNSNMTFTFTTRLSDGSVFHDTTHYTMNANGEITTAFDKPSCH